MSDFNEKLESCRYLRPDRNENKLSQ